MKSSKQNSKFKIRFTIPTAVLSLAVASQLSGCSQQRHVTEPSPEQPAAVTQPVAAQPAPAVVVETPEPAPAVVTPAPAPLVVVRDGNDGRDGIDGRHACDRQKLETAVIHMEDYEPTEVRRISTAHGLNTSNAAENLPYLTQLRGVRARLGLRSPGEGGNATGARGQQRFNRDTYVIFKMRIAQLIQRRFVRADLPITAVLNLNLSKQVVSGDPYIDTEAVCVLDAQKCSGKPFVAHGWDRLINRQFNNGNPFVNTTYVGQQIRAAFGLPADRTLDTRAQYNSWFREWARNPQNRSPLRQFTLHLDLAKLLHANPESGALSSTELLDLLYGNAAPTELISNRELHFAVLDDLLVNQNLSSMELNYRYNECDRDLFNNPSSLPAGTRTEETPRPAAPAPAVVTPVETAPNATPTEVPATPATPAAPAVEEAAPAAAPETTPAVQTPAAPGTPAAESNTNDSEDTE